MEEEEDGEGLGEVSWRGRSVPVHGGGVPKDHHVGGVPKDHHVGGVLRHDHAVHGVHDSHEHKETDDDESFSGENLSMEKS